jgi:hypothetical protein
MGACGGETLRALGAASRLPLALAGAWMPRLVERELAAVRKRKGSEQSPAGVRDRSRERDPLGLQLCHRRVQVVGHEVQLVTRFAVGRVDRKFRRRETEDRPATTGVDRCEPEHIAQKRTDASRLVGEHDRVGSGDHCRHEPTAPGRARATDGAANLRSARGAPNRRHTRVALIPGVKVGNAPTEASLWASGVFPSPQLGTSPIELFKASIGLLTR